jgi:3-methyladenine DNA glycosylase/8-oxoguanine DNA glycosylase
VGETFLRADDYDRVLAWLDGIKGIGPWCAVSIMLRSLGRVGMAPLNEKALVRAASVVYSRILDGSRPK